MELQVPWTVKVMALILPAIVAVAVAGAPKCESTRANRAAKCEHRTEPATHPAVPADAK
jgi:hypothetical protein